MRNVHILCSNCPPSATAQAQSLFRHSPTALSMMRWSCLSRTNSSTMRSRIARGRPWFWSCTFWYTHSCSVLQIKAKGKGRYSSSWGEPHLGATGRHLPYGIIQCYLPRDTSEAPRLTPAIQAGTRFTNPGGMEGWVDLVDLIAPRPGVELTSDLSITSPTPNHCTTKTTKDKML